MSFEVGPSASNIYVTNDGLNGQSFEIVERLAVEVADSPNGFDELLSALGEVIAEPTLHSGITKKFREQGRFLIGISEHVSMSDSVNRYPDGLLYAEGLDPNEDGSFSVVRMGTWMRLACFFTDRMTLDRIDKLNGDLEQMALTDVAEESGHVWGVPVNRLTRIEPLHPEREGAPDAYAFGHPKELEAVSGLNVPGRLREILTVVTKAWHEAELSEGGDATLGRVFGELTLQFEDHQ